MIYHVETFFDLAENVVFVLHKQSRRSSWRTVESFLLRHLRVNLNQKDLRPPPHIHREMSVSVETEQFTQQPTATDWKHVWSEH